MAVRQIRFPSLSSTVLGPAGLVLMLAVQAGGVAPLGAQVFYSSPHAYDDDDPQWGRLYGAAPLPGQAIVRGLRQDGFRPLGKPVLNRDVYVLDALDPDGISVRLIVGAFDGEIVQAFINRRAPSVQIDPDGDGMVDRLPRGLQTPPLSRPASPPLARLPDAKPVVPRTERPAVTPQQPTLARRSPLALPKEPDPVLPQAKPAQGSKASPRVIPIGPDVKAPATTVAPELMPPVAAPQPLPRIESRRPTLSRNDLPPLPPAPATPDLGAGGQKMPSSPPSAILDFRSGKVETD